MLYPARNPDRQCIGLAAFWACEPNSLLKVEREGWSFDRPDSHAIAVPAGWNNQFEDLRRTRLEYVRFQNCPGDHPNGVNHEA
jgi:hypothetical protein